MADRGTISHISRRALLQALFALGTLGVFSQRSLGTPLIPTWDPEIESWGVEPQPLPECTNIFPSFFMGGFECSTHLYHGRRLDLTSATQHDRFAREDYERLKSVGMFGCRDGISWTKSEPLVNRFDFSRARVMARAAQAAGVTVAWDLLHFGWPPHVDVFSPSFPQRFKRYAIAALRMLLDECDERNLIITPINEISFLSWAAGEVGFIYPNARDRGPELKMQLVRASLEGMRAMKALAPQVRFLHTDPLIHVASASPEPREYDSAEYQTAVMYQAFDMLSGRIRERELGGAAEFVDIIGVNYYPYNQRLSDGRPLPSEDPRHRPLSRMLLDVAERYNKPLVIAETGVEDDHRARWMRHIVSESKKALESECPLCAVTWYPILNHPGWRDDRHVQNGLWDYASPTGARKVHKPLAQEVTRFERPLRALSCATFEMHRGRTVTRM